MKGIVETKDGRFIAQYWNRELGTNVYIGKYNTIDEAIYERANHITKVYDGEIDDSLPKERKYPKGIDERHGRYRALICVGHGTRNKKTTTFHVGTFDTIEEAVQARTEFIEKLL